MGNEFLDIGSWVDSFEVEVEPIEHMYSVAKTNYETKTALEEMGPAKFKKVVDELDEHRDYGDTVEDYYLD
jgi:hypothetical protein